MLGGGLTGAGLAHPARVATTKANAVAARANFSDGRVVRGNFAADQFDLLRPRIGFGDWPQYKLVEAFRNVLVDARDDIVGRAADAAFEEGFGAAAHRGQHR